MKKLSSEVNKEKADNVLKDFLKELNKNGFSEKIKKYLSLIWQEERLFKDSVKKFLGVKFKVEDFKFKGLSYPEHIYRYDVMINDMSIEIMVQPLHETHVPYEKGFYGIIPSRLFVFAKQEKREITELMLKDITPELSKEEKDRGEIYIQYLKDGGEPKDFEKWLEKINNSGHYAAEKGKKAAKNFDEKHKFSNKK